MKYPETVEAARSYRNAGLSVLPIRCGGAKAPYAQLLSFGSNGKAEWGPLAEQLPTDEQMQFMFPANVPQGVAVIGGPVSGCIILDVDSGETSVRTRTGGVRPQFLGYDPLRVTVSVTPTT